MLEYLTDVSAVVVGIFLYRHIKERWNARRWKNYGRSYYGDIDDCK